VSETDEVRRQFCALILEDDLVTNVAISKALNRQLRDSVVLSARSIEEARVLLAEYDIHFFILDVNLPDGSGIDFLLDIQSRCPGASVIVVTAEPLPEYRDQANAYDVLRFMEKPVDYAALAEVVRSHRDMHWIPALRGETSFFAASLSRLTVLDIIQLKCLNKVTQVVDFIASRQGRGRIYFQNGEIIHAETASALGLEAFNEVVGWKGGRAVEVQDPPAAERTIHGEWQGLLLNAAQANDERNHEQG
jgi:response regulator RpfG family c-di-GMP phosphodiesterase